MIEMAMMPLLTSRETNWRMQAKDKDNHRGSFQSHSSGKVTPLCRNHRKYKQMSR